MNIEIEKQRNDLLHRTNIIAKITAIKTPERKEVLKKVSAMLGVDEKLVSVDTINQEFGKHNCVAYLKVYDDVKYLKNLEQEYKIKRTGELEAPKEEAPNEDAPKEEAPKEEAKKEVKEEAPKEEAPKEEAPKEEAPKE